MSIVLFSTRSLLVALAITAPLAALAAPVMRTVDFKTLPKATRYEGKVAHAVEWKDSAGNNLAIFTQRTVASNNSKYLRAYHYVNAGSGWSLSREVKDQFEKCGDADNLTAFVKSSIQVTDLDNNGIGELWFGYHVDCASDVSPVRSKLLVLEGGNKAILRGSTAVRPCADCRVEGGSYKPEPPPGAWKPAVVSRAKAEWKRLFAKP